MTQHLFVRPLLFSVLAMTSLLLAAAPARADIVRFDHEANEGNSAVEAGRHARSIGQISDNGRFDVTVHLDNRVALVGYCFNTSYFLRDAGGNILTRIDVPQMCVDGSAVFWGHSTRQQHFTWQIDPGILGRVRDVAVVSGPGSVDTLGLLGENVRRGMGIYQTVVAGAR